MQIEKRMLGCLRDSQKTFQRFGGKYIPKRNVIRKNNKIIIKKIIKNKKRNKK